MNQVRFSEHWRIWEAVRIQHKWCSEWQQRYEMSQSGMKFCIYFGFSARICFQRSGGQLTRQTGDTWRGWTDVDNFDSNLSKCSTSLGGGVMTVKDGRVYGVMVASYGGAVGSHTRQANVYT